MGFEMVDADAEVATKGRADKVATTPAARARQSIAERPESTARLGLDVFYKDALERRIFCAKIIKVIDGETANVRAWPDDGQPAIVQLDAKYSPTLEPDKTWCLLTDPGARSADVHGE